MADEHPDKEITIRMRDGKPQPDDDPVVVHKDKQKIRWTADFDFRITIEDYDKVKHSNGGGTSYEAKTDVFSDNRQHKYTISANGIDNDPTIDVQP